MRPTTTIFIGSPLSGDEARFLRKLSDDLAENESLILAKFFAGKREIDFVVITAAHAAAILELKNFRCPVFGDKNGVWTFRDSAGKRVTYAGINPYQQTVEQKYAVSDQMKAYRENNPGAPAPSGRAFYYDLTAFVCIWPTIHPDSQVTTGDHKVAVRPYAEIIEELRTGSKASNWSLADWRIFAENHLKLTQVTLEAAIDAAVYEAHAEIQNYRTRVRGLLSTNLPPLIEGAGNNCGHALIATALESRNHLFVGPSGSAKTFHLHHLALALADSDDEVPVLVEAKKYRGGDFSALLKQAIAPLFRGDPRDLLQAIRRCGLRPVLMIDALNECSDAHLSDLLRGAQAFTLHFDARIVLSAQRPVELPAELQGTPCDMSLPDVTQKRLIYAYHAGVEPTPDIDVFCSAFTNSYDLTLAGRCHQSGSSPGSRVDLYDRYVRRCLPQPSSVASSLLRHVAGEMGKTLATAWPRDTFETTAERFLAERQASLGLLDDLRACRLVEMTDDFFSFEHEMLFDYFKAEDLRRKITNLEDLAAELERPRNQRLLELVLPRFSKSGDIVTLLAATQDVDLLSRVCAGQCGSQARSVLVEKCMALLDEAVRDLPNIEARCEVLDRNDTHTYLADVVITGNRAWTAYDALLCDVIALNLDDARLQPKFLQLLDLTEWTLRSAVHNAARRARIKPAAAWEEVVRLHGGLLQYGSLRMPCTAVLSRLRTGLMDRRGVGAASAIRGSLLERAYKHPGSHFSLLTLLQDRRAADDRNKLSENLGLVKQGLESGIYILQAEALELLQLLSGAVHENCPDEIPRIREMINALSRENIVLNTVILETLAFYDGLDLVVSAEEAASEMRALITAELDDRELIEIAATCQVSPMEFLAGRAYGSLSRIFEDVFQGAYWAAYSELSEEEKGRLLCLAGQTREPGFVSDWILRELLRHGGKRALPIYERFAGGIQGNTCFTQDAVAAFVLGIQGWARWSETPPSYRMGDSPEHQAWQVIGEILYWRFRDPEEPADSQRFAKLWARISGAVSDAAADVLFQLTHLDWRVEEGGRAAVDLIATFPGQIRPIVEHCLAHRELLPSLFRYKGAVDSSTIRFLIGALGRIADPMAIPTLEQIADDPEFGRDAIQAIKSIQKRTMTQRMARGE